MGFRNNQDALQARADALGRELETAKARVNEAEDEAQATSAQIKELERERNKLAKRLRKFEGTQSKAGPVLIVSVVVLLVSGMAGYWLLSRAHSEMPMPVAVEAVEPRGPLENGTLTQFDLVNFTDLTVRALKLTYPGPPEAGTNESPKWLPIDVPADGWLLPPPSGSLGGLSATHTYESHLRAFLPLLSKALEYYNDERYLLDGFRMGRQYHVDLEAGWISHRLRTLEVREMLAPQVEKLFSTAETEQDRRVNAAWKLCSDIVPMLMEGEPIDGQVSSCKELHQELVAHMRRAQVGAGESFAESLTRFLESVVRVVETAEPRERGMAIFLMANQYAATSMRFRSYAMKQ